ncbi:HEXXH motif domain-containing protein [Kitasatospora sp. NPDC058965]|uniref:HEXXH motif domain-containing protein n=1 Tax=Kitasatospora sp. NPDC058965 TaxID=3346682 RepID=UPI003682E354
MTTVVPGPHRLPMRDFEALARGDGDARTLGHLLAAERSRRLLLLRALDDALRDRPGAAGPLPPMDAAWDLLATAQRAHPAAFDDVLMHPQTGLWLAHALRRLDAGAAGPAGSDRTAGPKRVKGEGPLWVVLGHLHALAAAAGVRASVKFSIELPVRDGWVILPTLGCAALPGADSGRDPWGVAELTAGDGPVRLRRVAGATGAAGTAAASGTSAVSGTVGADIELRLPDRPTEDGPGWYGMRRITVGAPGTDLSVQLDDLDPYRSMREPTGPARLSARSATYWQALLDESWRMLLREDPRTASAMRAGLLSICPLPASERYRPRSASAGDAFGGLQASEPDDPAQFAATLVHEFQHIKLGALMHLAPLHLDEPTRGAGAELFYAPWRDDPRPFGGLLQGVYAFLGVTRFWRAHRRGGGPAAAFAHFEFALWRRQLWRTLDLLAGRPERFTPLGREFLASLRLRAASWLDEPVPVAQLWAAEQAAADHRARWRVHHLRPDPEAVVTAARAWSRGAGRPPDRPAPAPAPAPAPTVAADPAARWFDTRAALTRLLLGDPAAFARVQALRPDDLGARVRGATAGDLALVAGDPTAARRFFLDRLAADPDSPSAWTGLGQALAAGPGPRPIAHARASAVLRSRPEVVRAVHGALRDSGERVADPIALAAWLADADGPLP